jgi:hypothetical protein
MDLLNSFSFPPEAVADFKRLGVSDVKLSDGVSRHVLGTSSSGVPIRFFLHKEKNPLKTRLMNFPQYFMEEQIEWMVDKRHKPTLQVTQLPEALLAFERNEDGSLVLDEEGKPICIGGEYSETYMSFRKGIETPGLALELWGKASREQVAGLAEKGIRSVEQLGALSRNRVATYPRDIQDLFDEAVYFLHNRNAGKAVEEKANQIIEQSAAQLAAHAQENALLRDKLEALERAFNEQQETKNKGGRPRKESIDNGNTILS